MIRFLCLVILCIAGLSPAPVLAQEGISVVSSAAAMDFPDSITFTLEAEGLVDITEVTLSYQVEYLSCVDIVARATPDFTPGQSISATWQWDMRRTGSPPPGVRIVYWWSVGDTAGHSLETAKAALSFDDDRFAWRSLTLDSITILWYESDLPFAEELMDAAHDALETLAATTGACLEQPATIYVYASSADLRSASVYSHEWTGGQAFSRYGTVTLGVSPRELEWGKRALAHELAHLVIHQITFNCYGGSIPRWLDEGLAMHAEGELEPPFQQSLEQAISQDRLISVRSLMSTFPADPDLALLSYAESYSIVSYLIETYGPARMLQLLDVFSEATGYDQALEQVYGLDSDGLDSDWRASLGLGASPASTPSLPAIDLSWLGWAFIALVLILVVSALFRLRRL